jgi:hypothetical protein
VSGEYLFGYLMAAVCFALLSWVECSGHRQQEQQQERQQQREQGQKELDALRLKMDAHRPKLSALYI